MPSTAQCAASESLLASGIRVDGNASKSWTRRAEGVTMALFSSKKLSGRRVAIIATNGVEQVELTSPKKALEKAGATVHVVSPHKTIKGGKIKAWKLLKWGDSIKVDVPLSDASVHDYDALHIPGGLMNPDILRMDSDTVRFVRSFLEAGKPVSAICHGPWLLIEAKVVRGRTLTSWPSLKTDLINAGAEWVDKKVVEDNGLVTSRGPQDLPAFNRRIIDLFSRAGASFYRQAA
jgi:protease I